MDGYEERLRLPIEGNARQVLFTKSKALFSVGYNRIVIGGRGPYLEFEWQHLQARWRKVSEPHYFFTEYRTLTDNVKIYDQAHRVAYADYLPGKLYVSPFDLYLPEGKAVIDPKRGVDDQRQPSLF